MNYRIFTIAIALLFVVQQTPAQIFQVPNASNFASPGPGVFTSVTSPLQIAATGSLLFQVNAAESTSAFGFGYTASDNRFLIDPYTARMISGAAGLIGWTSTNTNLSTASALDTILLRAAANTLALRNGTNGQTVLISGTYTDASNFRQGSIADSTGGVLTISSSGLGTGANSNTITLKVTSSGGAAVDALVLDNTGNGTFNSGIQVGGASGPRVRSGSTFVDVTNSAQNAYLPLVFTLRATGAAAPTIASAGTIAPTTPIVFISGTAAIATITAPSPISAGGGQVTFIPTGIYTTTTAGNLALATTAVVGKAQIWTFDVTTTKWYPSY